MDATAPTRAWLTIPNLLSAGRIVATPLLVWLLVTDRRLEAAALLGVMGITDFLDGYIARRTGTVSELGTVLDPVSDRVAVIAVLVTLLWLGTIPPWLGVPVLARDLVLSAVFLVLASRGFGSPRVRFVGKAATFVLLSALPAIVLGGHPDADTNLLRPAGLLAFGAGGILYFAAAFAYLRDVKAWVGTPKGAGA